ncbi:MAG: GWxTD domain-containing protein [bacterium]
MKKAILLTIMFFTLVFQSEAKNLWAFLTYSTFNSPDGPYIETYISIAGNSVQFVKNERGKFQATVNILMTFKQGDAIKTFSKYELPSPELTDTTNINLYFIDQQRILIPNGTYDFEIRLTDKNKSVQATPFVQSVTVDFPPDKPSISGIELVKSYKKSDSVSVLNKSGYDLVPMVYTFFPENEANLVFYCELYNLDKVIPKDQKFLISYYLETFENNMKFNDFAKVKREVPKGVNVLLSEINIENLASGNYNLVVEARNQQNELLASNKLFIQRINPNAKLTFTDLLATNIQNTFVEKITNTDSLKEYIRSTYPISSGIEKAFIRGTLKTADLKTLQEYFYSYWQRRDQNNPREAWLRYKLEVEKAQANFGNKIKKGYQTDRGRVFLEYGPPNARSVNYNEPSSYPYEIWQYYTLKQTQRNKKFVFYSEDMVTSDFTLLHSDAIGEVNEPRWRIFLRNRIYAPLDLGDTQIINAWGENANSEWDLPTTNL